MLKLAQKAARNIRLFIALIFIKLLRSNNGSLSLSLFFFFGRTLFYNVPDNCYVRECLRVRFAPRSMILLCPGDVPGYSARDKVRCTKLARIVLN